MFTSLEELVSVGVECIYAHEDDGEDENGDDDEESGSNPDGSGSSRSSGLTLMAELTAVLRKRCRNPRVNAELQDIQASASNPACEK